MTDTQKNIIFLSILFIIILLWQSFENKNNKKNIIHENKIYSKIYNKKKKCKLLKIKTDVLYATIDLYGGNIKDIYLLKYKNKLGSKKPVHLLKTNKNFLYQANSGIIDIFNKKSFDDKNILYHSKKKIYSITNKKSILFVPIKYISSNGLIYKKTFIFNKGDFSVQIDHDIYNNSNYIHHIKFFGKLKQSYCLPINKNYQKNKFYLSSYRGAAYSTNINKYKKYSFKDIKNNNLNLKTKNGWIAMLQQYFVTAWIPLNNFNNNFYSNFNKKYCTIGFQSPEINILPKSSYQFKSKLWAGPEIQEKMKQIAPYLDLTVDYGWLWFLSQPIFKLLKFINFYTKNWGFSIIIITIIIRLIMYPMTKSQYISMAKMKKLHPKLLFIKEKFKNDKQKQSKEIILLYKKEKVNPFSGLFSLVIQMPIFLSLYYVLSNSIELRHSPFILWIYDLSDKDPLYVLPIIMGITMFFIQKFSPSHSSDKIQKKIIMFTPLIFVFFFLWFPSGLVLYYIISNLITIIQQYIISKKLKKYGLSL